MIEETLIPAQRQHLVGRELVLDVCPRDPDLEREEALGVIGLPVLAKDLAWVHLRAEELADPVAVNGSARVVRDPLAPLEVELGLAVGAGPIVAPVLSRQDDDVGLRVAGRNAGGVARPVSRTCQPAHIGRRCVLQIGAVEGGGHAGLLRDA